MSDDWIIVISEDPYVVPDAARRNRAKEWFLKIAPAAEEIRIIVTEQIEFFHCGANFGRISCPTCSVEIPLKWWQDRMDEDYGPGFKLAKYPTPCCGATHRLHDLVYEWPQGFGRFAVDALNPNLGLLDEIQRQEFEQILGTPVRIIYRHM